MARYRRSSNRSSRRSGINRSASMRSFAYKMGCVERGLQNPDSQITDSFNAGKNASARKRKSLY